MDNVVLSLVGFLVTIDVALITYLGKQMICDVRLLSKELNAIEKRVSILEYQKNAI